MNNATKLLNPVLKPCKNYHGNYFVRGFLCMRMAFQFFRMKLPRLVVSLYVNDGQGYIGFAVPFRGVDFVLFALPYQRTIFRQFGHKFLEFADDETVWTIPAEVQDEAVAEATLKE